MAGKPGDDDGAYEEHPSDSSGLPDPKKYGSITLVGAVLLVFLEPLTSTVGLVPLVIGPFIAAVDTVSASRHGERELGAERGSRRRVGRSEREAGTDTDRLPKQFPRTYVAATRPRRRRGGRDRDATRPSANPFGGGGTGSISRRPSCFSTFPQVTRATDGGPSMSIRDHRTSVGPPRAHGHQVRPFVRKCSIALKAGI